MRIYSYHQVFTLTYLLHQDKWYPHQESIRVPLIIKDPRMDDEFKGTTNDDYTLNVDLTATILSAAGVTVLPTMMGRDMSELYRNGGLKGEPAVQPRRAAFANDRRQYPKPAKDGNGTYHSGTENSWRTECKSSVTITVVVHSHSQLSNSLLRANDRFSGRAHPRFRGIGSKRLQVLFLASIRL